nr:membrane-spanning 4-domains subfamily A member 3-like [Manis javanica]
MDYKDDELRRNLLAFGAIEILSGTVILALGFLLGSLQGLFNSFEYFSFFLIYTGYPIWGPLFFIVTGSSSLAAGKNLRKILDDRMVGRYIVSAIIALVGAILLSANLAFNNVSLKNCALSPSPDLCLYMGTSNNGLMTLMLIFTLLELIITISTIVICWKKYLHFWSGEAEEGRVPCAGRTAAPPASTVAPSTPSCDVSGRLLKVVV